MKIKLSKIIAFVLIFLIACSHWLSSSVFEGTLIATSKGLIPVERLKVGDKVISCKTDGILLEVPIKKIHKFYQNKAHRIFLNKSANRNFAEERYIYAPPSQELYDPFLRQWFKAEQVTINNWVMNDQLNVFPVEYVDCVPLNVSEYHLEVDEPHVLFISNCSYSSMVPGYLHQLVLIHNFIPDVAGSVSFAEIGVVLLKATENTHPVVKTVASLVAVGAFFYEMFKPDTTKKEEQPQIWQLNNMPQQGGGNQPSQGSNTPSPQQKPDPNNQKQNQKPFVVSNEKRLRTLKDSPHEHIFGIQKGNGLKHEFHKVNKDINNLADKNELIDKAVGIVQRAHNNGRLPEKGPFTLQEILYGNHWFEVRGAVVDQKTVINTFFHVKGCC